MAINSKKIKNSPSSREADFYQGIVFSVLIGAVFLGIVAFLVYSNLSINGKRTEMSKQIDSLQKEIKDLQDKKASLQSGIDAAKSDSYWESKAREQGYQKSGEEQVVVIPPQENQTTTAEKPQNFLQKMFAKWRF